MPRPNVKSHRYGFRIEPKMFERLRQISITLMVPLPDLIVVAVLHLFSQATSPIEFTRLKANAIVKTSEHMNKTPPPPAA